SGSSHLFICFVRGRITKSARVRATIWGSVVLLMVRSTIHAVAYARVSSKDQEKEGFSIPAQQRLLRDYAAANGIVIVQEFVDVETARKSGREGFGQMLDYLKKHERTCTTILVEKTDRMYRNIKDYATVDELGLTIHFVKENVIISPESRSADQFMH